MAHTKAGASTKLGRDSESKRLGVKLFDGQKASVGNVLIRQRGRKYLAGENTEVGGDDTIYALKNGTVKFTTKRVIRFNGLKRTVKVVNVI